MSYYEHSKCPSCGYDFNLETKDSDSLLKEVEKKNITVFNICKKSIDFSLDGDESLVVNNFLKLVLSVDNDVIITALEGYLRTAKIKSLNVAKKFIVQVMKNRNKKLEYERERIGSLPPEK
tara:strand:+ start:1163 stop:1525 length:363 start_codon:yes stop_codon:yes gene_type:complete